MTDKTRQMILEEIAGKTNDLTCMVITMLKAERRIKKELKEAWEDITEKEV